MKKLILSLSVMILLIGNVFGMTKGEALDYVKANLHKFHIYKYEPKRNGYQANFVHESNKAQYIAFSLVEDPYGNIYTYIYFFNGDETVKMIDGETVDMMANSKRKLIIAMYLDECTRPYMY